MENETQPPVKKILDMTIIANTNWMAFFIDSRQFIDSHEVIATYYSNTSLRVITPSKMVGVPNKVSLEVTPSVTIFYMRELNKEEQELEQKGYKVIYAGVVEQPQPMLLDGISTPNP